MEDFDGAVTSVISYPSSPDPVEGIYQELTEESIHCAMEEQDDADGSLHLARSASSPDRIFANNHNLSGNHRQDSEFDDTYAYPRGAANPPTTSPEPPPPPPPLAQPTGILQSEMRAPSPDRMYRDMIGDLEVMMEIARSMHDLARHTKSLLHTAYERVDLSDPRVRNLGIAGVLKDLRQQSAHAVVDGQRSQLRYEKVLTDVRRLRRCLRNLGFWRVGGGSSAGLSSSSSSSAVPSQSPPQPDTTWGLPHHSYFSNDF